MFLGLLKLFLSFASTPEYTLEYGKRIEIRQIENILVKKTNIILHPIKSSTALPILGSTKYYII